MYSFALDFKFRGHSTCYCNPNPNFKGANNNNIIYTTYIAPYIWPVWPFIGAEEGPSKY